MGRLPTPAQPRGALDTDRLAQLTAHFDALPGGVSGSAAGQEAAAGAGELAAECAALRSWLALGGQFRPEPRDPPWADPRPDLAGDHNRWAVLLALAWACDGADPHGVYGALQGLRCCGAALVTEVQPRDLAHDGPPLRWRLTRGELSERVWQVYRTRWLLPHRPALTRLLRGGGKG